MSLINFIDDYIDYYGLTREDPTYHYNGVPVPRTTDIISSMLHEQGLMEWSNKLGKYQKKDYNEYMNTASTVGTCVHSFIEEYLQDESEHTPQELPFTISDKVFNAYHSFKKWWVELNKAHKVKIIFIEKELTCEFFGGRLDLLLEIDGLTYLVDFKSSNHASYKYFLQLSSYKYMLNMKENIRQHPQVTELLVKAVEQSGITPCFKPIRGGTDGSRLTEMGIPCPNIFTGGHNFHSRTEWASLSQMLYGVETVLNIIRIHSDT